MREKTKIEQLHAQRSLFAGNSTSNNKEPVDKHVHKLWLLENKGKGGKMQSTINKH